MFPGVPTEDYNTPGESGSMLKLWNLCALLTYFTFIIYIEHDLLCLLAEYRAPTPAVGTPKPINDAGDDDDEPPLNEDDDDDDELDDLEQGEDEPNTQHLVLAQFDKVGAFIMIILLSRLRFSPLIVFTVSYL